ncbi:hypothetical protein F5Y16DRAFT_416149 [Xylariaceae sp. FL0255]|nr:hypothetical protein F5Y16DRAFT_416149 [Xylariaceae sp. FL0255]
MGQREPSRYRPHHHVSGRSPGHQTNASIQPQIHLGRLDRDSQETPCQAKVESWLQGQVAAAEGDTGLRLEIPRTRSTHPRHVNGPPFGRTPERVDPLWRPQHIPPDDETTLAAFLSPLDRKRKQKRRTKHSSDDSSLIQDLGNSGLKSSSNTSTKHRYSWHPEPLSEALRGESASSLSSSAAVHSQRYEKRPRYKTKANKYDTKKSAKPKNQKKPSKKTSVPDSHEKSRPKGWKRKTVSSGKNVMNNFVSDAVSKERITVHPPLKPGLFENKREPKRQPVPDLSFSDMGFLKYQKREAPQPKSLSKSRLKELRRASRELEQISSFFAQNHKVAPSHPRRTKHAVPETSQDHRTKRPNHHQSMGIQNSRIKTVSLSHQDDQDSESQQRVHQGHVNSLSSYDPTNAHGRPAPSKATTYFTWSSSHYDTQEAQLCTDENTKAGGSTRSDTPESLRRVMVATGVYKDTKISPYDNPAPMENRTSGAHGRTSSENRSSHTTASAHSKLDVNPNTMNEDKSLFGDLRERWDTILPHQWKTQQSIEPARIRDGELEVVRPPPKNPSAEAVDHQDPKSMTRGSPTSKGPRLHDHWSHEESSVDPNDDHASPRGTILSRNTNATNRDNLDDQDRVSITSRELMPPPPIPQPGKTHPTDLASARLGHDMSTTVLSKTVNPHGTTNGFVQIQCLPPSERCSSSLSALKTSTLAGRQSSGLGTVSWIPRMSTPVTPSPLRDGNLSRLESRPPIYVKPDEKKGSHDALGPSTLLTDGATESMADFIARIEGEVERQESWDLDEESSFPSDGQRRSDSSCELLFEEPPTSNGSVEGYLAPAEEINSHHRLYPTAMNPCVPTAAGRHGSFLSNTHESLTVDDFGGTPEDFLEMSRFWRPNQFSQF